MSLHGGTILRGAYKGEIVDWRVEARSVGHDVTNNLQVESILIKTGLCTTTNVVGSGCGCVEAQVQL